MQSRDSAVVVAPPTPSPARLAAYLAAGVGSSMLATAEVEAGVVAINLSNVAGNNITGNWAGGAFGDPTISISNWLGTGTGTFKVWRNSSFIGITGYDELQFAVWGGPTRPWNFAAGESIRDNVTYNGSSARWQQGGVTMFFENYGYGYYSPNFGAGSFMGFRFGSGSTWNYGYIEVRWTAALALSDSTFQLLSAAYESTVNTPIAAGAPPTPIPAPSALALLALGGGAFRRARQRAA